MADSWRLRSTASSTSSTGGGGISVVDVAVVLWQRGGRPGGRCTEVAHEGVSAARPQLRGRHLQNSDRTALVVVVNTNNMNSNGGDAYYTESDVLHRESFHGIFIDA